MKPRIAYLIDHIYPDMVFDQNCLIHNKDWLSKYYEIIFIVRTLKPTFVKKRANFTIHAFNYQEPYETLANEISAFNPHIIHIFGPICLGSAGRFVDQFHHQCAIVQQYAGNQPWYYGDPDIHYFIIDAVHLPAFQHIPVEKMILRNCCCDLDFFKPIPAEKEYDCIMAAGFYCTKGQDIVYEILKNDPLKIMFLGAQKSNMDEMTDDFRHMMRLINKDNKCQAVFQDYVAPDLVPFIYNKAKLFVWGSRVSIENPITITNRSVTEAVACGLPVVAFNETFKHSNFIINGANAILVNSDQEFHDAVLRVLTDDDLRSRMSSASRAIAMALLDFKQWHDSLLDNLYRKILNERDVKCQISE